MLKMVVRTVSLICLFGAAAIAQDYPQQRPNQLANDADPYFRGAERQPQWSTNPLNVTFKLQDDTQSVLDESATRDLTEESDDSEIESSANRLLTRLNSPAVGLDLYERAEANREFRQSIRAVDILDRPDRRFHFYGNAVRRRTR